MQRTESHILEDESRLRFKQSIPRNWIPRDQTPDYGYNFDVQIFDNETPTPFHFYVQLKSTNYIKKINKGIPLPFETKYFKLFSQGPFPVMICLYIKRTNKLHYLWLDDYFNSLDLAEYKDINSQKTKTIYLNKELKQNNKRQLENEVKRLNYIRNPNILSDDTFDIYLKLNSESSNNEEMIRKIFDYFLILHKIKYFNLLKAEKDKNSNLIINLDKNLSIIKYNNSKIKIPILTDNENLFTTIAISISYLLLQSGYVKNAGKLLIETLSSNLTYLDDEYLYKTFMIISKILQKSNNSLYIIEFSKNLKEFGKIKASELLAIGGRITVSFDDSINKLYDKNFVDFNESLIPLYDSDESKGICFYNMVNTLRNSLKDFRKAIKYYFKARRYFTGYEKQSYWWAELGGAFFMINKFRLSELFYMKSMELGEETIPSHGLMAEALLYQGKYDTATKELEIYLNKENIGKSHFTKFYLKWFLSNFLSRNFKDSPRKIIEAQEIVSNVTKKIISNGNKNEAIKELKKAIYLDPLCELAWYNHAVAVFNDKKDEIFLEWTIASILHSSDIESWTNALCLMIQEGVDKTDPTLSWSFIYQAFENFNGSLIINIENFFQNQNNLEKKSIIEIVATLKKMLNTI